MGNTIRLPDELFARKSFADIGPQLLHARCFPSSRGNGNGYVVSVLLRPEFT